MSPDTSLGRSSSLSSDTSSGRLIRLDTDIQEAVDAWSRYRNIVKDGFFVNDSMIVLADDDYYSDEEGGEISDNDISQDKGEAYDDQEEIIGITKESENISDPPFNNTFYSDIVVNEPQDSELGMKTNGLEQVILPQQSLPPLEHPGRLQGDSHRDDDCPGGDPVKGRPDDGSHQDPETGEGCWRTLPSPPVPSCCTG